MFFYILVLSPDEVMKYLQTSCVPEYMIPTAVVVLKKSEVRLTNSGAIDESSLPDPDLQQGCALPQTTNEKVFPPFLFTPFHLFNYHVDHSRDVLHPPRPVRRRREPRDRRECGFFRMRRRFSESRAACYPHAQEVCHQSPRNLRVCSSYSRKTRCTYPFPFPPMHLSLNNIYISPLTNLNTSISS